MWFVEHTLETTTLPEAIWRRWSDLESWPDWNDSLAWARLSGPASVGATGALKLHHGTRIRIQVVEMVEGERWVLAGRTLGITLRFVFRVEPADLGARLTHRVECRGPLAWIHRFTLARRLREGLPRASRKLAGLSARLSQP